MDLFNTEKEFDNNVEALSSTQDYNTLSRYSFKENNGIKPIMPEELSKISQGISWNAGFVGSLLVNMPFLMSLKKRANQHLVNSQDKKTEWQHLIGPALVGYVLATLPEEKINTKKVIELLSKSTLAIMLVDHYVDATDASKHDKLLVINKLRLAFENGYNENSGNNSTQLDFSYALAGEVYLELKESKNFDIFVNEIRRLAEVGEEQFLNNKRSLFGTIKAGSRSMGVMGVIPCVLNENIPKRFLRASKHFGAMMEIADDLQDRDQDLNRGFKTFASELEKEQTQHSSLPPIVSAAFIRQARKCFKYLTVSERDGYLFLWRTLKLKWDTFNLDLSQVNPPTNYSLAGPSIASKSTFRAVTEHGSYWGPFFIQPRIGKGGKIIKFYKLRSMKPFGDEEDTLKTDSTTCKQLSNKRTTFLGNIIRKYFLDEVPQIINILKGDLKIVGLRPRPEYQFHLIEKSLQAQYLEHGPGFMDLNYAFDVKPTDDDPDCSKQRTELIKEFYDKYEKNPLTTTGNYMYKIAYNIIIKGKRGV